jgi:hypothetical protein
VLISHEGLSSIKLVCIFILFLSLSSIKDRDNFTLTTKINKTILKGSEADVQRHHDPHQRSKRCVLCATLGDGRPETK